MKLLLTSTGITNKTLREKLIEMVGKRLEEMTVAFVPTAIHTTSQVDKRWMIDNLRRLDDMKIAKIDIVDIAAIPKEMWLPRLEKADVIYVEGGNPTYLMSEMKKTDLIGMFDTNLADKVYVGCSAGSTVMGKFVIKSAKEAPGYRIEEGFNLVDFSIRPHFYRPDRTQFTDDLIQELTENLNSTFYALDDESGIAIEGDKLEIVSEGKWKKFER